MLCETWLSSACRMLNGGQNGQTCVRVGYLSMVSAMVFATWKSPPFGEYLVLIPSWRLMKVKYRHTLRLAARYVSHIAAPMSQSSKEPRLSSPASLLDYYVVGIGQWCAGIILWSF